MRMAKAAVSSARSAIASHKITVMVHGPISVRLHRIPYDIPFAAFLRCATGRK
jgi:hypothetical protein